MSFIYTKVVRILDRRNTVLGILLFAFFVAYAPTYLKLINGPWRTEQEGHGPIIILAALWAAWQRREDLKNDHTEPATFTGWMLISGGLVVMFLARVLEVLFFDVLSEIPILVGCLLLYGGWQVVKPLAFPIGFLFFSAPPPAWLLDAGTVPLKGLVSDWVTQALYSLGYPIAQNGVMIMIGQYQLLVKDACAGMNSIFALTAIGIYYTYAISNGSVLRKIILLLSILPITIIANFIRVLCLVLIAYYGGVKAIDGSYHELTGVALFLVALALVFFLDEFLSLISRLTQGVRILNFKSK